ncbi:hypothetical protein DQ244_00540 [Blastococcus sp. TBT05-19]|uniref:hypothetical protein n=1 Tax=Blastococcus sp. TBT05-19 TaxID=2250581 RepID=UPI000DEBD5FD|nr:hypothetical protein [Blastococcus sp. TBT05-19]RBY93900.1 hypothetical protein DQ244_00540 [Blastococcus sp. TBT05-19]
MSMGTLLLWPTTALLGFLLSTAVVVLLGSSSTARYEFERNGARTAEAAIARSMSNHPAGRRVAGGTPAGGGAEAQARPQAVAVAERPEPAPAPAAPTWWLVGENAEVLSGPFDDRLDADWALLDSDVPAVAVFGARRADGTVAPRPTPEDRAWLTELGDQLDRLPEDWDALLSDTDPLTTLVVEIASALLEAGLPLYDAAQETPSGGVWLAPDTSNCSVLVSWRTHSRMSAQGSRGPEAESAVLELMNATVADVLAQLGFVVQVTGPVGCSMVTALR